MIDDGLMTIEDVKKELEESEENYDLKNNKNYTNNNH
jgi:hypothetical protein